MFRLDEVPPDFHFQSVSQKYGMIEIAIPSLHPAPTEAVNSKQGASQPRAGQNVLPGVMISS
ncbi:hypothetical protein PG995_011774 [Apiospora arundinis]